VAELSLVFDLLGRDRASPVFDRVGDAAGRVGDKADRSRGKLDGMFGDVVRGAAAFFAFDQVKDLIGGAVTGASDLNETVSKSNAIFGANAAQVDAWAQGAAESVGLSRAAALDAAAGFGNMFTQLGFAGDQAATMSQGVVQMAADLGSFNNLPTADVAERISGALRGEYDSLQALIPNISAARVEQEAMAATGKTNADQLTAQEKAAATLAIVQADGVTAMGDFARTSDGLANSSKTLSAQWDDMKSRIGQALLPAVTGLVTYLSDTALPGLERLFGFLSDNQGTITVIAGLIGGVLGAALLVWGARAAAAAVRNVMAWGSVVNAASRGSAATGLSAMQVVAKWTLMGARAMAQAARMAAAWFIALGPIGWAIAAIIGIVAVVIANWDKIKAFTVNAWNAITEKVSGAWRSVKEAVTNGINGVVDFVRGLPGKIMSGLGDLGSLLYNAGRDLLTGLKNGITNAVGAVVDAAKDAARAAVNGVKSFLGISSPSKVFERIGGYIGQGLVKGLTGSAKDVAAASRKLADLLVTAHQDALKRGNRGNMRRTAEAYDLLLRVDDRLIDIAKRREDIAKQLEAARTRLTDAVKMRDDFATAVRDSARQFASITSIKTAGSPAVLIDEMRNRLDAIRTFREQLAALAKMGLSADVYEQIASAGVDAGGATAEALLAGGKAAVDQVNGLQAGIASESAKLGQDSSRKLYQAGVDAATGLARGLASKSATLQQAANQLAANLETAVKRRLGIRSPSTVFEQVGTSIGEGLAQGIAGMRPVVAAELAALANTQAAGTVGYRPPGYDMPGSSPTGRGGATYVTTVSGVASPEQVAAVVDRAQRTTEFLAGAGL
jgi:hypothetical protein